MKFRFGWIARWLLMGCIAVMLSLNSDARTRPQYGGELRVEVEGDPLPSSNGIASRWILDGLTQLDEQRAPRPALATRWTSENNDHRWQFWLRGGVSFHNNHPLNGQAVAASLEESCRTKTCPWTSIRVQGQSVIFLSDNAMPALPAMLSDDAFLIRASSGSTETSDSARPDSATTDSATSDSASAEQAHVLIGTGPFKIKEANANTVTLDANEDCWQGRPFFDRIRIAGHRPAREQWLDVSLNRADLVEVRASEIRQAMQQRVNVVISADVTLLELEVRNAELSPQLRTAIALAVDRSALYQVIFQKQGELTASLLPAFVSGYGFLFPTNQNLAQAQALRGGISPAALTLGAEGTGPIQLAGERLALNLHDAGFNIRAVQPMANGQVSPRTDLILRTLPLPGGNSAEALTGLFRLLGLNRAVPGGSNPEAAYIAERDFLNQHAIIPLLYLPRAWAISGRVRDFHLTANGLPDLANMSLTNSSTPPNDRGDAR